ncbi:putative rRNA-processing protein EBP2 [Cricetulus griseus]|uniref:Putative rRNA-processing protein EBP2 n=1 Tax=Cricetulus griseus TaxID=10029 RepID=G3IBY6_CRIGR|nr:putative rRNA-processing protein EBP2 [Cricetulus griseus]
MDTPLLSDWDEESEGSLVLDQELQEAFSQVLLKPGLSVVLERPKKAVNDANGLKQCLAEFKRDLERVERLDVTLGPVPELQVSTKRPTDYFAEMAKSDQQTQKIRQKLQTKQAAMEKSEKAKQL